VHIEPLCRLCLEAGRVTRPVAEPPLLLRDAAFTQQTLRLGTDGDGALVALHHHTKTMSSTYDDFFEPASTISQTLYASSAIATFHEGVRADIGTPQFMRAPGEASGSV
jgi:xanthine dehydrogenase YagR molybdenum-binding subunit